MFARDCPTCLPKTRGPIGRRGVHAVRSCCGRAHRCAALSARTHLHGNHGSGNAVCPGLPKMFARDCPT
eukprot:1440539-Prymnesium_polylepis.1